jgi:hypothetical protein
MRWMCSRPAWRRQGAPRRSASQGGWRRGRDSPAIKTCPPIFLEKAALAAGYWDTSWTTLRTTFTARNLSVSSGDGGPRSQYPAFRMAKAPCYLAAVPRRERPANGPRGTVVAVGGVDRRRRVRQRHIDRGDPIRRRDITPFGQRLPIGNRRFRRLFGIVGDGFSNRRIFSTSRMASATRRTSCRLPRRTSFIVALN